VASMGLLWRFGRCRFGGNRGQFWAVALSNTCSKLDPRCFALLFENLSYQETLSFLSANSQPPALGQFSAGSQETLRKLSASILGFSAGVPAPARIPKWFSCVPALARIPKIEFVLASARIPKFCFCVCVPSARKFPN